MDEILVKYHMRLEMAYVICYAVLPSRAYVNKPTLLLDTDETRCAPSLSLSTYNFILS